jgi:hypothetical protein
MSKSKILTFIAEGGVRKAVKEFGKEAVKEATEKPAREASIDRLKRIRWFCNQMGEQVGIN